VSIDTLPNETSRSPGAGAQLDVALSEGWDKAQAKELLDAAVAFEPTYYNVYREYLNFLLPKWYGEPGEAEAFAEQAKAAPRPVFAALGDNRDHTVRQSELDFENARSNRIARRAASLRTLRAEANAAQFPFSCATLTSVPARG
jgi:hypothetical protein